MNEPSKPIPANAASAQVSPATSALQPIFQVGETVWSAIDADERGMITAIINRGDALIYQVTWASDIRRETGHSAFELSREPNYQQPTR